MYHIFFNHFSVDGHLGCFYVLAIVNSAVMNIGVHVSFWSMVFSRFHFLHRVLNLALRWDPFFSGTDLRPPRHLYPISYLPPASFHNHLPQWNLVQHRPLWLILLPGSSNPVDIHSPHNMCYKSDIMFGASRKDHTAAQDWVEVWQSQKCSQRG